MDVKKDLVSSRERSRGYMPRRLAKDARKKAIRLDGNNASAWFNKGIAFGEAGRGRRARYSTGRAAHRLAVMGGAGVAALLVIRGSPHARWGFGLACGPVEQDRTPHVRSSEAARPCSADGSFLILG